MRFCIFLILLFGHLASGVLLRAERPNIIVILVDDVGYSDLGCYGSKVIATTRLDRIALERVRFTDFYVASAACNFRPCVRVRGSSSCW